MATEIKEVLSRLFEETLVKGNVDVYDEIVGAGYRSHDPLAGESDLARAKEQCRMLRAAFPDLAVTFLGTYAEGDTAIAHWRMTATNDKPVMNFPPTGKRLTVEGITIGKFRDGKLVEDFTQYDAIGALRELGIAQPLPVAPTAAAARPQPTA